MAVADDRYVIRGPYFRSCSYTPLWSIHTWYIYIYTYTTYHRRRQFTDERISLPSLVRLINESFYSINFLEHHNFNFKPKKKIKWNIFYLIMTVSENRVALASSLWILAHKLLCRGVASLALFSITFMISYYEFNFQYSFFHFHYATLSHVWQIHRIENKSCGLHMGSTY